MLSKFKLLIAASGLALFTSGAANAAVTVTFTQVDNDIRAVASGTLNITGLSRNSNYDSYGSISPFIEPSANTVALGFDGFKGYDINVSGSTQNWGIKFGPFNGSGTGSSLYFNINGYSGIGILGVPVNYASNSLLSSAATFANQSFAALGIRTGNYSYLFNSGANADTITFFFDPVAVVTPPPAPPTPTPGGAVPEPSTWAMMILGMGAVGYTLRRRRAAAQVSYAA